MAIKKLQASFAAASLETRLSLLAVAAAMASIWLGLLIGFVAVWRYSVAEKVDLKQWTTFLYFAPTAIALGFLAKGESLPTDDLLRHIGAGGLGFDYRSQYPWADLPKANLWLGFDWVLWQLQLLGLSKEFLRQWIPGLSLILQSVVLYGLLRRAVPAKRTNPALILLAGALGLLLLSQRSLLGRPEMFLLLFAATAGIPRTWVGVSAWIAGFLLMVPSYWLAWAYAPFALLLWPERLSLAKRIGIAVFLSLAHLAFWQGYTGDYIGLMFWLKGTLSVLATENYPLHMALYLWHSWAFLLALAIAGATLTKRRVARYAGFILLFVWLSLPDQIRYHVALGIVGIPWVYRQLTVLCLARPVTIPTPAVLFALAMAGTMAVPTVPTVPEFKLPATARVYSEAPYATVFHGERGISVDPSFAFGATRKPWDTLKDSDKTDEHCAVLREGGFTHVLEKSRKTLLECGNLVGVEGNWRLWELKK